MRGRQASQLLLTLAIVAACASSTNVSATLSRYAVGQWSCQFTVAARLATVSLAATAKVTASDATDGGVELVLPPKPDGQSGTMKGQWSLRGGRLTVRWTGSDGVVQAQPISLTTRQFQIKEDHAGAPGSWVDVRLDRQARQTSFSFTAPGVGPAHLQCQKG